jgi:hypothetical protein
MKKMTKAKESPMRREYDFTQGVRGKYARRYAQGTNIVLLDPDIARAFPDSRSVNTALRRLVRAASKTKAS